MMIADISLLFDAALAALLAVMIFYAVRLNKRIAMLRDGEGEMQQMIARFSESSLVAQESARQLKAAGTEAEFGVKAAVAKGMAVRNDLEMLLDQAELLVDRLDDQYRVPAAPPISGRPDPAPRREMADRNTPDRDMKDRNMPDRTAIERELARHTSASAQEVASPVNQPDVRDREITAFSPPIRSADEVIRAETVRSDADMRDETPASLKPRTEAERHLLDAIRAAKQGVA